MEASAHHSAHLRLRTDPNGGAPLVDVMPGDPEQFGWTLVADHAGPVEKEDHDLTLLIGLKHRWFAASGPPARRGGTLEFLMDGEEAWERVQQRLERAQESVHLSTWWGESRVELSRSATLVSREVRRSHTGLDVSAFAGNRRHGVGVHSEPFQCG